MKKTPQAAGKMPAKCAYCGRTEICPGVYPEGCFLENDRAAAAAEDLNQ